tara:strand:- start:1338 stop:2873 length:1536 start_codon:yes stop_codon:yes gene_type:complete
MAADAGLIKSASQAYRSQDPNIKLGESLRYGFDKISQGIAKGQEIKRAQKEKDDLKKEKQAQANKAAQKKYNDQLVVMGSAAKTSLQQDQATKEAIVIRKETAALTKELSEIDPNSERAAEIQDKLFRVGTRIRNMVASLNQQNENLARVDELMDAGRFSSQNSEETKNRTAAFLAGDIEAKFDEEGNYVIKSSIGEDGESNYLSLDDYYDTLSKETNPQILLNITDVSNDLQKDGDNGLIFDETKIAQNLSKERGRLSKETADINELISALGDKDVIQDVDLSEGNEQLLADLKSDNDEVRIKAKNKAIEFLYGTKENIKDAFLYKSVKESYEGRKKLYDEKQKIKGEAALRSAAAKGDKSAKFVLENKKRTADIKALGNLSKDRRGNEYTINVDGEKEPVTLKQKLLDLESKIIGTDASTQAVKTEQQNVFSSEYKDTLEDLKNSLRKIIGGGENLNVELVIDSVKGASFKVSGSSVGAGDYTVDEIFNEDTSNPNNLLSSFDLGITSE